MKVGKYAGMRIDQLPNSYLRWMITQGFDKEIVEIAQKKLEQSKYDNTHLDVSRHAIDMFSKRFLHLWIAEEASKEDGDGIATYMVKLAEEAWEKGADESKHRHHADGIVRVWKNIQFVFQVSPNFPDYKQVITVMIDN